MEGVMGHKGQWQDARYAEDSKSTAEQKGKTVTDSESYKQKE